MFHRLKQLTDIGGLDSLHVFLHKFHSEQCVSETKDVLAIKNTKTKILIGMITFIATAVSIYEINYVRSRNTPIT